MVKERVQSIIKKALKTKRSFYYFFSDNEGEFIKWANEYLSANYNEEEFILYPILEGGICLARKDGYVPCYLELQVDWKKMAESKCSPDLLRNSLWVCADPECGFHIWDEVDEEEEDDSKIYFLEGTARLPLLYFGGLGEWQDFPSDYIVQANIRFQRSVILDIAGAMDRHGERNGAELYLKIILGIKRYMEENGVGLLRLEGDTFMLDRDGISDSIIEEIIKYIPD